MVLPYADNIFTSFTNFKLSKELEFIKNNKLLENKSFKKKMKKKKLEFKLLEIKKAN